MFMMNAVLVLVIIFCLSISIIPFNFTSEDLHSGQKIVIEKGNENIYSFDSLLLSVKTKREHEIPIILDK